ncbi:conserved hypothetical protein [anaerobic digester metagenome]|uniref:Tyrosine-protein phosphatase domain-containing protein n=1 Tax=anaerobic digester metagenome TaxID=1263854 RepID=A0A485M116_9ZZZZ
MVRPFSHTCMHHILEQVATGEYDEAVSPGPEITALLCVAQERNLAAPRLPYHKVPLAELETAPGDLLADAAGWIHSMAAQGHRVLVFSSRGISRPPSVVIAYLCLYLGCSFGEALHRVTLRQPSILLLPGLSGSIDEISTGRCR